MKRIKDILFVLFVLFLFFTVGVVAVEMPSWGKAAGPDKPINEPGEYMNSGTPDRVTLAIVNAIAGQVYLPASFGYRIPEGGTVAVRGVSSGPIQVITPVESKMIAEEGVAEVYLKPMWVGTNTYDYYDEEGVLFGRLATRPEWNIRDIREEQGPYSVVWAIPANSKVHGDRLVDASAETVGIYYNVVNLSGTSTYIGFYDTDNNTFYWVDSPFAGDLRGHFRIDSSRQVYFAMKNSENATGFYAGQYWPDK